MLEELKRCNSIGNKEGIIFISDLIFNNGVRNIELLNNLSQLNNEIRVNTNISIVLFSFIDIVNVSGNLLEITRKGKLLSFDSPRDFSYSIGIIIIKKLIQDKIINVDDISIVTNEGKVNYIIKTFPLVAAVFRNLLYELGLLRIETGNYILIIPEQIESIFLGSVKKQRKLVSLDELKRKLELQSQQGQIAEKWVLYFERKRLNSDQISQKIRIISDIDVQAGYDIISFKSIDSLEYDRFIEVKSFVGSPHFFWSRNEVEIANLKGESYFLYLIDYVKMNLEGYQPIIIQNPKLYFFENPDWIINTQSYHITKI